MIIGASILFVLLLASLIIEASQMEEDLRFQIQSYADQSGFDWLTVEVDGQALMLSGSAPHAGDRKLVAEFAKNMWGVSEIVNDIRLLGEPNTCQSEFDNYLSAERIEFEKAGAEISLKSLGLVDRLSDIARNCDARIRISGHTDSDGDGTSNLHVSTKRAHNLRKRMLARGVPESQVTAVGYGETRPIADNSTPEGREKNRRIEIRVTGRT